MEEIIWGRNPPGDEIFWGRDPLGTSGGEIHWARKSRPLGTRSAGPGDPIQIHITVITLRVFVITLMGPVTK